MGWERELKQTPFRQLSSLAGSRRIPSIFSVAIDLQEKYFKLEYLILND